jgi:hypothetical protein
MSSLGPTRFLGPKEEQTTLSIDEASRFAGVVAIFRQFPSQASDNEGEIQDVLFTQYGTRLLILPPNTKNSWLIGDPKDPRDPPF